MVTRIITLVLLLIALTLGYVLYSNVKGPVDEKVRITNIENAIKAKMKLVRDLQVMYKGKYGKYAGKWDNLKTFAKGEELFVTQPNEISELDPDTGVEKVRVIVDTLGTIPVKDSILAQHPNASLENLEIAPGSNKQMTLYAGEIDNSGVIISVFEVRDEYPINPSRGGQLDEEGKPYSVTTLIKYFEDKLAKVTQEAIEIQRKMKGKEGSELDPLQEELDEVSKYVNLYGKRIEQLQEEPLKLGSRVEASTSGNWE